MNPVERLKSRISSELHKPSTVGVCHRYIDSPVGKLLVISTPYGISRVSFETEDQQGILSTAECASGGYLENQKFLDIFEEQIGQYFNQERGCLSVPVDVHMTSFAHEVLDRLREITYGRTLSYGEFAAVLGHPSAARAVGSACASNPVPMILPCHRVIRSDGSFGEYIGGVEAKKYLLDFEHSACR